MEPPAHRGPGDDSSLSPSPSCRPASLSSELRERSLRTPGTTEPSRPWYLCTVPRADASSWSGVVERLHNGGYTLA